MQDFGNLSRCCHHGDSNDDDDDDDEDGSNGCMCMGLRGWNVYTIYEAE